MRYRKEHICSVMLIALLLIVVGGLLTSCSNDDTQESKSTSLQIMGFTRSGDPTQSYEGKGDYSPINLFLVDGETQKQVPDITVRNGGLVVSPTKILEHHIPTLFMALHLPRLLAAYLL